MHRRTESAFERRETPFDGFAWWADRRVPETPIEALMRCGPFEEPAVSREELLAVREVLADAFDVLTDEEVWVFNALVIERLSLRTVARQISTPKTTIARIRDRAICKLRSELEDDAVIRAFHFKDSDDID